MLFQFAFIQSPKDFCITFPLVWLCRHTYNLRNSSHTGISFGKRILIKISSSVKSIVLSPPLILIYLHSTAAFPKAAGTSTVHLCVLGRTDDTAPTALQTLSPSPHIHTFSPHQIKKRSEKQKFVAFKEHMSSIQRVWQKLQKACKS